jgi:drug/metabolite transporter (DMT)-like permease
MKNKQLISSFLLLLAAIIWGFAFVAQRMGMEHIGPFLFNGIRFLMGSLMLLPVLFVLKPKENIQIPVFSKKGLMTGTLLGVILFLAASAQQIGMVSTTAGNAGFITGLYVIFVPIFGVILGQVVPKIIWPAAVMAIIGLYLLSVKEGFIISKGDLWVSVSAVLWAIHVLLIGRFSRQSNPIFLAFQQFAICGILSIITAFSVEIINMDKIMLTWGPLLYGGILSVGVAFTLQVVGQKNAHPASASLLLSSESLFAAIGGWLILNEKMSVRAIIGCILILSGIILVQVFQNYKKKQMSLKEISINN